MKGILALEKPNKLKPCWGVQWGETLILAVDSV